jgi:hypothetical protein
LILRRSIVAIALLGGAFAVFFFLGRATGGAEDQPAGDSPPSARSAQGLSLPRPGSLALRPALPALAVVSPPKPEPATPASSTVAQPAAASIPASTPAPAPAPVPAPAPAPAPAPTPAPQPPPQSSPPSVSFDDSG